MKISPNVIKVHFTMFSSSSSFAFYLAVKEGHIDSCIAMVKALQESLQLRTATLRALLMNVYSNSRIIGEFLNVSLHFYLGPLQLELGEYLDLIQSIFSYNGPKF